MQLTLSLPLWHLVGARRADTTLLPPETCPLTSFRRLLGEQPAHSPTVVPFVLASQCVRTPGWAGVQGSWPTGVETEVGEARVY